ncbi:MAG TPA: hypothetical protein VMN57_10375 [Anaerolineales bacterium]|nr:hypothetical protein [Anaerolineales bacterium]
MYEQNQPSLMGLLGTVVVFVVAAGYGIISMSTEDPLWFIPTFSEAAAEATIYCRGSREPIGQNSPHLEALNGFVNQALSGRKNWDSLTMSDDTYRYYQESDAVVALEIRYNRPVRVHSIYKYFSGVEALVIPLLGRHSNLNAVFGLIDGQATAGALHIESTASMLDYITANGLCSG